MTVGARPFLSTGGVGGGEAGSKRGVVQLAIAVAGSRWGGSPTVVTSLREWCAINNVSSITSVLRPTVAKQ